MTDMTFKLESEYTPQGDQPTAILELGKGVSDQRKHQVLLGVTGSGKTFTMANVIARSNLPSLIIAPNKTLAGQLYGEFKALFPQNAVEYFVSYYDYYQPEAYIPQTDTYIEKDAKINDEIDRMRHSATRSLLSRNDVIIVASVSCIYGLGSAEAYYGMLVYLEEGQEIERRKLLRKLVEIQYDRNDIDFHRGTFRVRGDVIEIFPAHEDQHAIRIELFGDTVESIKEVDPLRGRALRSLPKVAIYPNSHYVTPPDRMAVAIKAIKAELSERLGELRVKDHLLEIQRLEQRTLFDLEMLEQIGYCPGIENYSRHLSGRDPGQPPPTLLDYFPKEYLIFVDECHVTVPQLHGMYRGDRARKEVLVEYGFRLPSALDNRPLRFEEFEALEDRVVYVSATPGNLEVERAEGVVVEQIIRPTGLIDPPIEVRPATHQVDDLLGELRLVVEQGYRVLVTTLTKRMAEDLTDYYQELGIRVRYLHSDIDTIERSSLIRDLRLGVFDVLVGINLLREGLDLPEVSLVAILDADKEGFLRSERSLIQTCGRAARNVHGRVVMYADKMTRSMQAALDETKRRRAIQRRHNEEHGITPRSVEHGVHDLAAQIASADYVTVPTEPQVPLDPAVIDDLRQRMLEAAASLEFERAAELRDQIILMERGSLGLSGRPVAQQASRGRRRRQGR